MDTFEQRFTVETQLPQRHSAAGGASLHAAPAPEWIVPARLARWQGAMRPGESGVEAAEGFAAYALFEVPAIPDLSSPRFADLTQLDEAQRIQRMAAQQTGLLAALHPLGDRYGFSLRYLVQPQPGGLPRIRLFLLGRSFAPTAAEAAAMLPAFRAAVRTGFPAEYPLQEWKSGEDGAEWRDQVLCPEGCQVIAETLKPEHGVAAWHDPALCGFEFYYHVSPFAADSGNDMIAALHALRQVGAGQPLLIDVTLIPAQTLTSTERAALTDWITVAEKWGRDQKLDLPGGLYSKARKIDVAADPHAQDAKKMYAELLNTYGSPPSRLFLSALRVAGADRLSVTAAAEAIAARVFSPGSAHQLLVLEGHHPAFERARRALSLAAISPAVCNEPLWGREDAPETLRRLHRLASLSEIASAFRLPIAGRDGCPGIPLDSGMPAASPQITTPAKGARSAAPTALTLGHFLEGGRRTLEAATVRPADLCKHALIVGAPGSGKTTFGFALLTQLWRDHQIPFLVLEPAKTEYRALLDLPGLGEALLVFTPGNERTAPFRFNPLEIPDGVAVAEHIGGLATCFSGAFSLHDPLPMLLDEALRETYAQAGFSEYGVGGDDPTLEPPTLADLKEVALAVAARSSYKGDLAGNLKGALETRLGSLTRGPKGRCFNTRRSVPLSTLMTRPVVLEMEALGEDEKSLLMMFLLTAVRAYARTARRSGAPLSHVTLIEEAHVVLGRSAGPNDGNQADPQGMAVRFFVRMLAEMRALGEGLVVADQLPTAVAPEVLKLTGLKVMHRVVSGPDRQELGQAMLLDPGQIETAATLPPGHSLMFGEGWARSRIVAEENFKDAHGLDVPPGDADVREAMAPKLDSEALAEAYLPYADCGDVCRRCDGRVREESERWLSRKLPLIQAQQARRPDADPQAVAFEEFLQGVTFPATEEVRWHCAQVHFLRQFQGKSEKVL